MSRYDHKIETSLEGIEHLSKEKKEKKERKMKEKNHYYLRDTKLKEKGNVLELVQEYALAINLNPIHNPANAKKVRTGLY